MPTYKLATSLIFASMLSTSCTTQSPFTKTTTYKPSKNLIQKLNTLKPLNLNQHTQKEKNEKLVPAPEKLNLSINQAISYAIEHNLDLKTTRISPKIASENIIQANAAFDPSFSNTTRFSTSDAATSSNLEGTQAKSFSSNFGLDLPLRTGGNINLSLPVSRFETNNTNFNAPTTYNADLAFSISHPLLRGAGAKTTQYNIRISQIGKTIVDAQTKLQALNTVANTQRQYWNLYAATESLNVTEQEIKLAQAQLQTAKNLVAAGTAAPVEILRSQAGLSSKIESLIIAQNNLKTHQRQLKKILNIPNIPLNSLTNIIITQKPTPIPYNLKTSSLLKLANENRTNLLEIELQLLQDASAIDIAKNQLLPLLNLSYSYNANGLGSSFSSSLNQAGQRSFEDHAISLTTNIPLGNRIAKSKLRSALLSRLQRITTKKSRQQLIKLEVLNAADQLQSTWQRILASQNNTLLSARLLKSEQRQFKQGQNTSTDILNAQTSLANAQLAEINALKDYQIATIDLAVATGTVQHASNLSWQTAPKSQNSK